MFAPSWSIVDSASPANVSITGTSTELAVVIQRRSRRANQVVAVAAMSTPHTVPLNDLLPCGVTVTV